MDSRQEAAAARIDAGREPRAEEVSASERPDVTRRRVLAATGLATAGVALSRASTASAAVRGPGLAPLNQVVATFIGVLIGDGKDVSGYAFLTEVKGLGALGRSGKADIPSTLGFRLKGKVAGHAGLGGVAISRLEGRLTFIEPSAGASLEKPHSFEGGRTVAEAKARLQSVLARGEGVATVTGDVIQKGSGRVRVAGGSASYGRDGLVSRLWATGPIVATEFDASRWTHQIAGNLIVTHTGV